ncbi:MAG: GIY-YIG nuclease family protein [Synergistaceae bacterium]|jgi:putative endonuclease|nr:GIY-YIG nuclease family protein [Synergistaceae bacterium]
MTAYVYIVRCSDSTLYTGWTYDVDKRILAHNNGSGAKYTRGRTPVLLCYTESFETKEEALSREMEIKKLKRSEKEKLLEC